MDITRDTLMDLFDQARKYVKKRLPERRRDGRLSLAATVQVMPYSGAGAGALLDATLSNLSTRGLGLLASKSLTAGQQFCLRLPAQGSSAHWIRSQVTRWQAASNGTMLIGARFIDMICTDSGELPMLIDPSSVDSTAAPEMRKLIRLLHTVEGNTPSAEKTIARDHRRARRVKVSFETTSMLIQPGAHPEPLPLSILDISTSGVGFIVRQPLHKDARLALNLQFSKHKGKSVLAGVVRCTNIHPGQYHAGAVFMEAAALQPGASRLPARWLGKSSSLISV